jgi:hypothetical protein
MEIHLLRLFIEPPEPPDPNDPHKPPEEFEFDLEGWQRW